MKLNYGDLVNDISRKEDAKMTTLLRNMIKGAGTIFCIAPSEKLRTSKRKRYNPHRSGMMALKSDWEKVGKSFSIVLDRSINEKG